jgi:hypothetical protein
MAEVLEDLNMIAKKTIGAAIIALATLAAVPASAGGVTVQFGFDGPGYGWHDGRGGWRDHGPRRHELSPQQVRRELRDRGYSRIRYFDRRGSVYQVRASRSGRDFYLVVSARNGNILSRHRI